MTSRHQRRGRTRKLAAASLKSLGNALAPAVTLNRMHQSVPSIIRGLSHIFGASEKCTIRKTRPEKAGSPARRRGTGRLAGPAPSISAVAQRPPRSEPRLRRQAQSTQQRARARQSPIARGGRNVAQRERRSGISPELPQNIAEGRGEKAASDEIDDGAG